MKRKIKVTGVDGKVLEGEQVIPNKSHLDAQIKYPARVWKNKKKYNRKLKHKKEYE